MFKPSRMEIIRSRIGWTVLAVAFGFAVWAVSPPIPWTSAPSARPEVVALGRELFIHEWRANDPLAEGDGLGPVFNAKSCAACHSQGGVGGAGPNSANVFTFAALQDGKPELLTGLIHKSAVAPEFAESIDAMRRAFPVQTTSKTLEYECGGSKMQRTIVSTVNRLAVAQINTPPLFGLGWVDRIPGKTLLQQSVAQHIDDFSREFVGDFSAVPPGRPRFLKGGRIGKFGWKAQFATLEEFVAAACANELGLGVAGSPQAKPFGKPDYPASKPDLSKKQFAAITAFVDTLPKPIEIIPVDPTQAEEANRGKRLFHQVGCAVCHAADLGGVKGLYSDLLLHAIEDEKTGAGSNGYGDLPSEDPSQEGPRPNEWKTPPLWGVADSAPYFHDGGSATLEDAILRHAADAKSVANAYKSLADDDQKAIVVFLQTLKAPPRPILTKTASTLVAAQ